MSHAKRLCLDDCREVFYLDDLLSAPGLRQPLLLLLGEDSWHEPTQALSQKLPCLGPERPAEALSGKDLVYTGAWALQSQTSALIGLRGVRGNNMLAPTAVVAECVVDFEEACASGAWLQRAEAYDSESEETDVGEPEEEIP
ncbi:unnamed protein product, partial [Symbiodinium sp. KB8]